MWVVKLQQSWAGFQLLQKHHQSCCTCWNSASVTGGHLRLLRSASFPLTCGEALTSFCGWKVLNTSIFEEPPVNAPRGLPPPTLSPASLFRVLFMISSRRCTDQTSELSAPVKAADLRPSHLLPLQSFLLLLLEVFLPLQPLALGLLAGFSFGLVPLRAANAEVLTSKHVCLSTHLMVVCPYRWNRISGIFSVNWTAGGSRIPGER